jgi:hypothetical protein
MALRNIIALNNLIFVYFAKRSQYRKMFKIYVIDLNEAHVLNREQILVF